MADWTANTGLKKPALTADNASYVAQAKWALIPLNKYFLLFVLATGAQLRLSA